MRDRLSLCFAPLVVSLGALAGCGDDTSATSGGPAGHVDQALFVASAGKLSSFDIESGEPRAGSVPDVAGAAAMQALADGTLLLTLTERDELLAVDAETLNEKARIPSSPKGATHPGRAYLTPERNGKRYWLALNEGIEGNAGSNSAVLLDVSPESATYLQPALEFGVGIGYHVAAFSASQERVVVTNGRDCNTVLGVYDYTDITNPKYLSKLGPEQLGYDGKSPASTCSTDPQKGSLPSLRGCATSSAEGHVYCNMSGRGDLLVIGLDDPTIQYGALSTEGIGGGDTLASLDGAFVYSLQSAPREGDKAHPGATCQVGQLVAIDAASNVVASEVPLFYEGPGCQKSLAGTDEESAYPEHLRLSANGKTLFVTLAGGEGIEGARVRMELVLDLSAPGAPAQKASIAIGASSGKHGDALSGDGAWLFVANDVDGTVSQIDVASLSVTRTLATGGEPTTLATFGTDEGPGL